MIIRMIFIVLTILVSVPVFGGWQEIIDSKKLVIDEKVYQLILLQFNAYKTGKAPKIAESVIKEIPIVESHEKLIDIYKMNHPRISMLQKPSSPFESPDHNSGFSSSSKVRSGVFEKLKAMVNKLDACAKDFGYEPNQVNIKIFEGLRDLKTQKLIFDNKADEIRKANPNMNEEEIFNETSKWVSPVQNNIPVHSTGGAVDFRLWDNKNQKFLDMGIFGVIWGKNSAAPTFAEDLTDEQKNNRLFALVAATQSELVNYVYEFWHFSHGDRYANFWQQKPEERKAIYNSIS